MTRLPFATTASTSSSVADSKLPVLAPIKIFMPQTPSSFSHEGKFFEFSKVPPK